jgi:hypothetical protein
MLNLRVSSTRSVQQRPQEVFEPGLTFDFSSWRQGNSNILSFEPAPLRPRSSRAGCLGKMRLDEATSSELVTLCSLPAFANRGPDDCGANSSSAAALCAAACCTHDTSSAVPPGSACRRGPRGRPTRGNHGGPDHRFAPGRCLLEVWDRP